MKFTTIDANWIEIKMIPFDTRIRAFLHRHCNALEENKSIFFYVDRGGYIGKLDLEKD